MSLSVLRRVTVVLCLLFAQWVAGAHAVEHAVEHDEGLPHHACQLCLTAQHLGSPLSASIQVPIWQGSHAAPSVPLVLGRLAWPTPEARQGAPPTA